jgi:hypothetical protein
MSDSSFETGEGFYPRRETPSSGAEFVRATFSHKERICKLLPIGSGCKITP